MPGEGNGVNKGDQRAGWVGGAEKESIEPLHIRWPKDWSFNFSINPSNEWASLG